LIGIESIADRKVFIRIARIAIKPPESTAKPPESNQQADQNRSNRGYPQKYQLYMIYMVLMAHYNFGYIDQEYDQSFT